MDRFADHRTDTFPPPPRRAEVRMPAARSTPRLARRNSRGIGQESTFGALAACGACLLSNPFDVAKSRLQIQRELGQGHAPYQGGPLRVLRTVAQAEGLHAVQRGLAAALGFNFTLNFLRFGLYDAMCPDRGGGGGVAGNAVRGGVAGGLAAAIASPFAMIRVRQQIFVGGAAGHSVGHQHQPQDGVVRSLRALWREGSVRGNWGGGRGASAMRVVGETQSPTRWVAAGMSGLYAGAQAQAMRGTVATGTQFAAFDLVRPHIHRLTGGDARVEQINNTWSGGRQQSQDWWHRVAHTAGVSLSSSAIAQFVATVTISPFDVTATRLYNQPLLPDGRGKLYSGAVDCLLKILRTEGMKGLYKGFSANLVRQLPHGIATFTLLDQLRLHFGSPALE